jgi:hypothetical protein
MSSTLQQQEGTSSKDAFDQAIGDFSAAYADKNEQDFACLDAAAASGQIPVQRGL